MPVQLRPTITMQESDPSGYNPQKRVTIDGQEYVVTRENVDTLVQLRIAQQEKASSTGTISTQQKNTIRSVLESLSRLPTTGPGTLPPAPDQNFGSFSDYLGIFTKGVDKAAREVTNTVKAVPQGIAQGSNIVTILAVALAVFLVVKK